MDTLKTFDLYPKLSDEVRVKTFSGAAISIVAALSMLILFVSQLSSYLSPEPVDHLEVDTARGTQMEIRFDLSFPSLPCDLLMIEARDVANRRLTDISTSFYKQDIRPDGTRGKSARYEFGQDVALFGPTSGQMKKHVAPACGTCYGAERDADDCCSSCQDLRDRYKARGWKLPFLGNMWPCGEDYLVDLRDRLDQGHGCRVYGNYRVQRIAGHLLFIPGRGVTTQETVSLALQRGGADVGMTTMDTSHTVNRLSFGQEYAGIVEPLAGATKAAKGLPPLMHFYYAKVVPTTFTRTSGKSVHTNQYSATEHTKALPPDAAAASSPGVYVAYELSPIHVNRVQQREPLLSFVTQVCAIVGGVFAVAGLVDRLVYSGMRHVQAKVEIGKVN